MRPPMILTTAEAALFDQWDMQAAYQRHEAGRCAHLLTAGSRQAVPAIDFAYTPAPAVTQISHYDADGRPRSRQAFGYGAEYEGQMEWHRQNILPQKTWIGWVTSALREDGSVTFIHEEVTVAEYYRRYRKWRRYLDPKDDHVRADYAVIDRVTGWTHGCDHWLLRLLGYGPRPRDSR